jgi:hypothetical protein
MFKFLDKGILYSASQLLTRPGNAIREYIEGKRVRHFEPLGLLVTFAALYGLLYHYFRINPFVGTSIEAESAGAIDISVVNDWISDHFALMTCLLLPIYSIGSYIAFRKQGYNFVEHLTLNTFLGSQRLLIRIALFPLMIIFNNTEHLQILLWVFIVFDVLLMIWGFCQFFNKLTKMKSFLLALVSYAIFFTTYFIILAGAILVIELLFANT